MSRKDKASYNLELGGGGVVGVVDRYLELFCQHMMRFTFESSRSFHEFYFTTVDYHN